MPTNLPPEYFEADKRYRAAETTAEKISALEDLLSTIPKHKGTDKLRADMRRRLAKLKDAQQSSKSKGKRDSPFQITREGAGQVVIIGATNVGKSSLVVRWTNASPEVSAAPLTTWKPTPGMMKVENVPVQLIDTPPLSTEYVDPGLFDLIRRADLVLLAVDLLTDPVNQLEESLAILADQRIYPLHQTDRAITDHRSVFKPIIVMANKCDNESCEENFEIFRHLSDDEWSMLPVSVSTGKNLEALGLLIFETLGIIRVYSKAPGEEPNLDRPFVLKKGANIQDFAGEVHQDFVRNLKSARVWGQDVFDGQQVGRDYILHEGDIVELVI